VDDDRVDRRLVNGLLTKFLSTEGDRREEVLRLLANILEFTPNERDTVYNYHEQKPSSGGVMGLVGGFFSSVVDVPPSPKISLSKEDGTEKNLSELWVDFLLEKNKDGTSPHMKSKNDFANIPSGVSATDISASEMESESLTLTETTRDIDAENQKYSES